MLLSDVTAADDWTLARSAVEDLGLPEPEDDDDQVPAGDLDIARRPRHARDGHGRAARRLRPLPRRDALRRRPPAGLRLASSTRPSASPPRDAGHWSSRSSARGGDARRARRGARCASPPDDVPIGAVVLGPDGAVIGARPQRPRARRRPDRPRRGGRAPRGRGRASGAWRLTGCTLVVTLEPCTMCAGAVVLARVERLVFGAYDEKAGAVGSLWDVVRDRRLNHRPEVVGGVLADECREPAGRFLRRTNASGSLSRGGVSERPKEHASKACVGASPPWVQIPPPPPASRRGGSGPLMVRIHRVVASQAVCSVSRPSSWWASFATSSLTPLGSSRSEIAR